LWALVPAPPQINSNEFYQMNLTFYNANMQATSWINNNLWRSYVDTWA